MSTFTTYYLGGYVAAAPAQNKKEQWDSGTGFYTAWNAAGAQTTQRALTAPEITALAAQDATATRSTNQATLTAQATAAITTNETWINNTAPQIQAGVDAIQARSYPAKATAPTTVAQVATILSNEYDQILTVLVTDLKALSQAVETQNAAIISIARNLDATMRLVAGALDSTSGT